jgi:Flp pilus assembly pilin Flp
MQSSPVRRFAADERGSVLLEYLIVATIGILLAAALVSVGPKTVENYAAQRTLLHQPNP